MRAARRAGAGAAMAAVLAAVAPGGAGAAPADARCVATVAPAEETSMTALVTSQRRATRAPGLRPDRGLLRAARAKSLAMARGARFAHSGGLGWARGRAGAQNIAMAPGASAAFAAMLGSPGHRSNILSRDWRLLGAAAARGCDGMVYFTLNFLAPVPR
jgi:uncharacterized protein YkwD